MTASSTKRTIVLAGFMLTAGMAGGAVLGHVFNTAADDAACANNVWECSTNVPRIINLRRNELADLEAERLHALIGKRTLSACDEDIVQSLAMIGAEAQIQDQVRSVTSYPEFLGSGIDVKKLSEERVAAGANDFGCAAVKSYPDYFAVPRTDIVARFVAPYAPQ
jgi:hypothetical protein